MGGASLNRSPHAPRPHCVHRCRYWVATAIVRSARQGRHERTPLQAAIANLVTVLLIAATVICVALAVIRWWQGYGIVDALLSAVTLAIAALPEEFPIVFTFFLGLGVYRLAQRQALVRRAVAVENIGRVTCICSDKTGTLTEGRLRVVHTHAAPGYTEGDLLHIAASASRSESGDPLDHAILSVSAAHAGERVATFPFTEDRRREVAVLRTPAGTLHAYAKGAPETVLAMATLDEAQRATWQRRVDALAAAGHKVLACAERTLDAWPGGEPDRDYRYAGLIALADPVRAGAADAVAQAQAAGIRVIMVTGDHPATATTVARALGIGADPPVVRDGAALAQTLNAHDGARELAHVDVIARAVPAQKLDLVRALQRAGEIVAVTGDGVNDVPALQGADIGIAMGERGTRPAREVAAIVLLDDNFRTIVRAIAEGRQLFRNLRLSFAYLLMVHVPLVLSAALIPLAGLPLLYLPIHIVWLELIIHPTALLVFQQLPPAGRLARAQRGAPLRFFDRRAWLLVAAVGIAVTLVVMAGYVYALGAYRDVEHARTLALVALIVAGATITSGLAGLRTRAAVGAIVVTLSSVALLVQVEPLATLLHLTPLHGDDWSFAAAGGLLAGAGAAWVPREHAP
jgi:Ca2+-transporting ATPase